MMNDFARDVSSLLPTLMSDTRSQELLTEILYKIDARLRWEAGPTADDLTYLAISPNFYAELLPLTTSLVSSLPDISGWVFLDAKPRKSWISRSVNYQDEDFCFDQWRYRLNIFKGGEFFDIDFVGCREGLSEDVRDWLAVFLASSELGERLFMSAVDRVSAFPTNSEPGPTTAIEHLFDHLSGLFRDQSATGSQP